MKILLAVETLHPGGAEMFALRVAAALCQRHEVVLLRLYPEAINNELVAQHPGKFTLAAPEIPLDIVWRKVDRLIRILSIDFSIREWWVKRSVKKLIAKFKPDVIHSNQVKVDYVMAQVVQHEAFVITLHGDYKTFDTLKDKSRRILNFDKKLRAIVSAKPAFVCIADSQQQFFESKGLKDVSLTKVYNGYPNRVTQSSRKAGVFTFGMIARGIREKGWGLAVEAFLKVQRDFPNTRLLLAGDSKYMQELRAAYADQTSIQFSGHTSDPVSWISQLDIGLLPSYYSSESLPTSVIEYLLCGIPVIAGKAGEIEAMIASAEGSAGQTIQLLHNGSDAERLALEMKKYLTDPGLYQEHSRLAKQAFQKFDMERCVEAYEKLYRAEKK